MNDEALAILRTTTLGFVLVAVFSCVCMLAR